MLNHSVATNPDTPHDDETPATAAQLWAHLGAAPEAANLPAPSTIRVGDSSATLYLHTSSGHDHNDLHTWVAWLGAGPLTAHVFTSSKPGRMQRDIEAHATWRSWDLEVTLIETFPAEQAAVAYGQTGASAR